MQTLDLDDVQARLPELLEQLSSGEELLIVRDSRTLGKLVGVAKDKPRRIAGRGKGKLLVWIDDDEHLNDFCG